MMIIRNCVCFLVFFIRFDVVSPSFLRGVDDPIMDHLASMSEEVTYYTPFFWHIHKAGGTTLHDFISDCLNFIVASEVGVLENHQNDEVSFRDTSSLEVKYILMLAL